MGDTFPHSSSLNPTASTSTLPLPTAPSRSALSSLSLDPSLGPSPLALDPALWSDDDNNSAPPASAPSSAASGSDDEYETESDETDAEEELAKAQAQASEAKKRARTGDKGKGRATELEVDGPAFEDGEELGRLISAIRDSDKGNAGGRSALEQEFDRAIEDELEQIDTGGLFAGTIRGKGKVKRGQRAGGRRPALDIEPSAEVRMMLGNANRFYATGELDEAIGVLTDVVRIDPSIRAPWYTLATIWEEKGDREKSIMFKIVGTHLGGTRVTASDWAGLGAESRDVGLLQQSIYCFTQAVKLDKNDVDSMWDRAVLLKLSGSAKQAIKAFAGILVIHPHDPGVLREMTPLLATTGGHARAMALLLDAYNFTRTSFPNPTEEDVDAFGPSDLESLADFLCQQKKFKECVRVIKEGVRWMQGRAREKGWDKLEDDREFDEQRKVRDKWEEEAKYLEEAEVYEMDVRLRARLGVARMALKQVEEAQRHFAIVLRESVAEFPELYGAIADAYFGREMWTEALDVYQDLAEDEDANGPPVWLKVAECNEKLDDYDAAKECYAAVIEEQPDNLKVKFALARCYEHLGEPATALKVIREVLDARRRQRQTGARVAQMPELFKTARTLRGAARSAPTQYDSNPDVVPRTAAAPRQAKAPAQASKQPFDAEMWEQLRAEAAAVQQEKARKQAEAQIAVQTAALRRQQERAMTALPAPVKVPKPKPPPPTPRPRGPSRLQEYIDRVAAMSIEQLSATQRQEVEQDLDLAEDLVAEVEDEEDAQEGGPSKRRGRNEYRPSEYDAEAAKAPRVPRMGRALRTSLNAVDRDAREQERKHEFALALQQLDILQAAVEAGDEGARHDWLSVATYLVDSFRETRQLFPHDGKRKFVGMTRSWKRKGGEEDTIEGAADQMEERLLRRMDEHEPTAVDLPEAHEFRGLGFDDWLKLIIKYAFLLVQNDEAEAGQETLSHVLLAPPFKSYPHRLNALRLARIACFLHTGDLASAVTLARTIILQNQFNPDALRLLQALLPAGQASVEMWNLSTLQKFTIRQLRLIDDVARGKEIKVGVNGQVVMAAEKEKDRERERREEGVGEEGPGVGVGVGASQVARGMEGRFLPTKPSPVFEAVYAGMLLTSKSYQSAIIYLLRALEQCPEQPLIHLCLAVSYLHRAMSRQTDNREHQIVQAFGFLSQYRDLVGPGQEVEYNFGRAFHQLGLNAHAVRHYEQCLAYAVADRLAAASLSDEMAVDGEGPGEDADEREYDDYAKAAAYNLMTLWMLMGRGEQARAVADRWLAV